MAFQGVSHVSADSPDKVTLKRVFYTGADALKAGYAVCYDRDNATATNYAGTTLAATLPSGARHFYVEKPAVGNQHWYAGKVTQDYPANANGQFIEIETPEGNVTQLFTDASCTIASTLLGVQAGSYAFGTATADAIAIALQTVDRSSTNGLVQAQVFKPAKVSSASGIQTPSSSVNSFSPAIWGAAPWEDVVLGRRRGTAYFEDFKGHNSLANNQTVTRLSGQLAGFTSATAGSTLANIATDPNGVLRLACTTDNEDVGIMALGGGNDGGGVVFSTTSQLFAEWRIKTANITDSKYSLFAGFAEEALCVAAAILEDDDTRSDKDYVAFCRLFDDGDKLSVIHNTASGGGETVAGNDVVTVVADTWINLGLRCDGTNVYFYANGVLVDTVALSATNFPDGEEMAFYYTMANGHADDATSDIDWLKILYVPA